MFVCRQVKTEEEEEDPKWSILREDFMMGANMKDWDKEGDEGRIMEWSEWIYKENRNDDTCYFLSQLSLTQLHLLLTVYNDESWKLFFFRVFSPQVYVGSMLMTGRIHAARSCASTEGPPPLRSSFPSPPLHFHHFILPAYSSSLLITCL